MFFRRVSQAGHAINKCRPRMLHKLYLLYALMVFYQKPVSIVSPLTRCCWTPLMQGLATTFRKHSAQLVQLPRIYIHIQPYITILPVYIHVQPFLTIQPYTAKYRHIQQYTTMYNHLQPYTIIYNHIQPYTASRIQPYTAIYSHLHPYVQKHIKTHKNI